MTNRKLTKRALFTSLMSMLLCVAMLIGTTYAWFTDSASAGVNKIVSGTLDVALVDKNENSLEGGTLNFIAADGNNDILWEPGCTYVLPDVYVQNNGNLALKYSVVISGISGDAKLNEALEWTISASTGNLLAGESSSAITISAHMKESAGNEYQGLSIDGAAVTVVATQDTVENDSTDNQYDANAALPIVAAAGFRNALASGGVISLGANISVTDENNSAKNIITSDTTINFDDNTFTLDIPEFTPPITWSNVNWVGINVNGGNVVFNGSTGGVTADANEEMDAVYIKNNATLTINGGVYSAGIEAVQVNKGTLYITGGTFKTTTTYEGSFWTINCNDANYNNGTAKVIITGGRFLNFNPANCVSEGPNTNFVASGYKVVEEADGSDIWYVVVPQ